MASRNTPIAINAPIKAANMLMNAVQITELIDTFMTPGYAKCKAIQSIPIRSPTTSNTTPIVLLFPLPK